MILGKNGKPFNQHKPDIEGLKQSGTWYRRHIVLDHPAKKIFIQIMWDWSGQLNLEEYNNIKKGEWVKYVPLNMIGHIRDGIASGYVVEPIAIAGSQADEEHTILQLVNITDQRGIVTDQQITQPIAEKN